MLCGSNASPQTHACVGDNNNNATDTHSIVLPCQPDSGVFQGPCALRELVLNKNPLGAELCARLESIMTFSTALQVLELASSGIPAASGKGTTMMKACAVLCCTGWRDTLVMIPTPCADIAEGITGSPLVSLNLSWNNLGAGSSPLFKCLSKDRVWAGVVWCGVVKPFTRNPGVHVAVDNASTFRLQMLDLSFNGIGDDAGVLLKEVLSNNAVLKELDVSHNNLGPDTGKKAQ